MPSSILPPTFLAAPDSRFSSMVVILIGDGRGSNPS
jgi:hypothetical protein